jgi:uncharacterized 2Fe-2S/4Fe-4S cluster protein (DUF4445 family)
MGKKIKVRFPLLNKSVEMPENSKISDACEAIGHPLNLVCGGKGKCKKCAVNIKIDDTIKSVLSCQTNVTEGLQILLKDEDIQAQILTESILKDIHFNPSLSLKYLPSESLKTEMAGNDWDTLEKILGLSLHKPHLGIIQKLSKTFHHPDGITCILYNNILIDVMPGRCEKLFGMAVDIGTTSVVGYLYDMKTMELVGVRSRLNKQTQIGGDVISRIDYSIHNPDGLYRLHSLAAETVNEIINNLCDDYQIEKNSIYQATFCGNSTMQHLFLKINPEYLGKIPFSSTAHQEISTRASELDININPDGHITFLPLLGGFVGADTTAVLMTVPDDNKYRLAIDLGTNGEIAVGKGTFYRVASTACGPALEGAGLESGMWGTTGAIERFYIIDGRVSYKVIGDVKPKGICGSGIIDIISELLVNDILTDRGALRNPEEIANADLSKRIIPWDKSRAFVVCFEDETETSKPILVTQIDIRHVQLAKGAIITGCRILIEKSGLTLEDIDEILVAGAFGNYIDIRNAQSIGMIPHRPGLSVRAIGNAAGTGCQMHMLSREKQEFCHEIAGNAIHVELALDPEFSTKYIMNTSFNIS